MLSCISCLYVLNINSFSDLSFQNILSHSVCSLFTWLLVSFAVLKPFSLIQSNLSIFTFVALCKETYPKKIAKTEDKEHIASISSYKFYGFKSLIHFRLIFVYGVRKQSSLILLNVAVQFSQNYLLKRLYFPYCISSPPLLQINCPYKCDFISGLSIPFP